MTDRRYHNDLRNRDYDACYDDNCPSRHYDKYGARLDNRPYSHHHHDDHHAAIRDHDERDRLDHDHETHHHHGDVRTIWTCHDNHVCPAAGPNHGFSIGDFPDYGDQWDFGPADHDHDGDE